MQLSPRSSGRRCCLAHDSVETQFWMSFAMQAVLTPSYFISHWERLVPVQQYLLPLQDSYATHINLVVFFHFRRC